MINWLSRIITAIGTRARLKVDNEPKFFMLGYKSIQATAPLYENDFLQKLVFGLGSAIVPS
jgi:hypothetical protein